MVAPPLDLAPDGQRRIGRGRSVRRVPARPRQSVECARKRLRATRRRRQPFFQLGAVYLQVSEQRIGQPPPHRRRAAAGRIAGQGARIEVERLDQPHQQRRRYRPLVALDQVQIAGRDVQHLGHRRLRQAILPPQPPHGMARDHLGSAHRRSPHDRGCAALHRLSIIYIQTKWSADYRRSDAAGHQQHLLHR